VIGCSRVGWFGDWRLSAGLFAPCSASTAGQFGHALFVFHGDDGCRCQKAGRVRGGPSTTSALSVVGLRSCRRRIFAVWPGFHFRLWNRSFRRRVGIGTISDRDDVAAECSPMVTSSATATAIPTSRVARRRLHVAGLVPSSSPPPPPARECLGEAGHPARTKAA